ncbi:MAG: CAP domain-containing protein [Bacteroidota bacterium]
MKMKMRGIASVILLYIVSACSTESVDPAFEEVVPEAVNIVTIEQELLAIVNSHRTSLGQNALAYSSIAYPYASAHTDYMISKGSLSHDNFSARASGISSEVNAETVAENVAKDYADASQAFQGWLDSSSHKKTMEGDFTHTAVSVKKDGDGNLYFTQLFYR